MSVDDYLELERSTPVKHEYVDGWVYAMGGGSDAHGHLVVSFGSSLYNRLPDGCQVFIADMKVHIRREKQTFFYYPDIIVSCDAEDRKKYQRDRPKLIVEVLSPSTARIDRREKFADYRQLDSLQEYVLVHQNKPLIEVYRRDNDWQCERFGEEQHFTLAAVGLEFAMSDLYRRVEFDQQKEA